MKEFVGEDTGEAVKQRQQQEKPSNDAFSRSSFPIFMPTKIYFFFLPILDLLHLRELSFKIQIA